VISRTKRLWQESIWAKSSGTVVIFLVVFNLC
jgi:hypothetical protein